MINFNKINSITGQTRLCGLIGNPVEHTLSPLIHNHLAALMNEPITYAPFLVSPSQIEAALKGAFALNILGLNVTVPYKSAVIPYLAELTPEAALIGAVNTLVRSENGYIGHNTDITGLHLALQNAGIRLQGEEVLILGAGGAARSAACLCVEKGARTVLILNRTPAKALTLAAEINQKMNTDIVTGLPLSDYTGLPDRKYLGIQTTSVGLHPSAASAVIDDVSFYHHLHTGYDLIYKPETTRFMNLTTSAGGRAHNGLAMLLYQAVTAFELWTRKKVPPEHIAQIYPALQAALRSDHER